MPIRAAASMKGSGSGLPRVTSVAVTIASKRRVKSSMSSIRRAESRWAEVQTAFGTERDPVEEGDDACGRLRVLTASCQ